MRSRRTKSSQRSALPVAAGEFPQSCDGNALSVIRGNHGKNRRTAVCRVGLTDDRISHAPPYVHLMRRTKNKDLPRKKSAKSAASAAFCQAFPRFLSIVPMIRASD